LTEIHVSCAVEGPYLRHSAAMLHSVLTRGGADTVHVHYLHPPGLDARDARRLSAMIARLGGATTFIEVPDERCRDLPTRGFTGKATWYKIFLPDLLPALLDRVLHLDADLIVDDSLVPLWETPLDQRYVAAVTNVLPPFYRHRAREVGLAHERDYFNAGVMLMNLRQMRMDGCSQALFRYGVDHASELVLRDQDALNAVLGRRRAPLHPRWNCMNSLLVYPEGAKLLGVEAVREARRRPAIRHFEGPGDNKPWHLMCRQPERHLYRAHRRRTPWPRYLPDGFTISNVSRRVSGAIRAQRRTISA